MKTKEERAAAMRDVYLGFTASADVAWDELPQRIRDRWLAVLDKATDDVPEWTDAQVEVLAKAICDAAHDSFCYADWAEMAYQDGCRRTARAAIAYMQAAPVPPSDDVIERMAKGHMGVISPCANWEHADKQYYMNAIRAALAAVGPQYCPADVAFNSRVPGLEKQIADLIAARETDAEEIARLTAENLRLQSWYESPGAHELAARKDVRERLGVPDSEWATEHIIAALDERDRLRDELAAAEIDLKDKAFYVREFAAVSAERDALRAELADVHDKNRMNMASCKDLLTQLQKVTEERDTLRAELTMLQEGETVEGIIMERDHHRVRRDLAEKELAEVRAELADAQSDDNTNAASVNDLLIRLQNVTAERDALKSQAVPGKIQWSIDADGVSQNIWRDHALHVSPIICARVMGELFNHAVIDAQQSQAVPVKPRFDVTAEELAEMFQNIKVEICDAYLPWGHLGENYKEDFTKAFEKLLPELAAHAVTDVPPGLPTVEDIISAWEQSDDSISPIRFTYDRLAPYLHEPTGWELDLSNDDFWDLIAEKPGYTQEDGIKVEILKRIRPTFKREYSEADVKALSEVLRGVAYKGYRHAARAALEGE